MTLGTACCTEVHDATVVEGNCCLEQEVCVAAGHTLVEMHVTDWAEAQKEDPMLSTMLDWLKAQKKTDLMALLAEHTSSEERLADLTELAEFHNSSRSLVPVLNAQGETKDILLFVVPRVHHVTALNGCHRSMGHGDVAVPCPCCRNISGGPGIANQMQQAIKSCAHCLQHESNLSKAPLHLIVVTASMDLLHEDFTIIEMTLELNRLPKVTNVLVLGPFHKACYGM